MFHISDEFPNIYIFSALLDVKFYTIWTSYMHLCKYEAFLLSINDK